MQKVVAASAEAELAVAGELGPRPAVDGPVVATPAQAEVFDHLRTLAGPASAATMSAELGLHPNTVREHLSALVGLGLVERVRLAAGGRGRPAYGYVVTGHSDAGAAAALLEALITNLAATAPAPAEAAAALGHAYAARLPVPAGLGARSSRRRRAQALAEAMRQLGYSAEPDAAGCVVRLSDCPLLDAARSHPDVVCGFHRGLAQGFASSAGLGPDEIRLIPFAELGACRLELTPTIR